VGITEAEAISRALSEVDNWHQLSRNINRARKVERQMNSRTKSLWLPGFTTLIAAACALAIVNRFNLEPRIYWYGSTAVLHWYASMAVVRMYLPWLAILPIIGGIGAYLSSLANGNLKTRLTAAWFPALVPFALFCPGIALAAVAQHHLNWQRLLVAFSVMVFNWVLLPGAVLALGALPFLRNVPSREVEPTNC
jgi:hypothetical protein